MIINREDYDSVILLRLQGDLGKPDVQKLSDYLDNLFIQGFSRFILDMEEIRFVDSHAIITLLRLNREALASGGAIKLLRPRSVVKRFLSIGKVLELFDRFENTNDAIHSFEKAVADAKTESRPLSYLERMGKNQHAAILHLMEMLNEKGYFEYDQFLSEMNRSSQLVFNIFREEINK